MGEGLERGPPRSTSAAGPRALEALLLGRVAALAAAARAEPRLLALPVRIVVPSRSLADHVGERLVAHAGRKRRRPRADALRARARDPRTRRGPAAGFGCALPDARAPARGRRAAAARAARGARRRLRGGRGVGRGPARRGLRRRLAPRRCSMRSKPPTPTRRRARPRSPIARVARRCLEAMPREGVGHRALAAARGARGAGSRPRSSASRRAPSGSTASPTRPVCARS